MYVVLKPQLWENIMKTPVNKTNHRVWTQNRQNSKTYT